MEHGADALGFVLWEKSPRYIAPLRLASIAREIPSFVSVVAVFVNPTVREVRAVLDAWPWTVLQFHGEETSAFCEQFSRPWMKTARARAGLDLLEYLEPYRTASAWLIDAFHDQLYGGTGTPFDWGMVPQELPRPMVLSGGLSAHNVTEALAKLRPYAVDVSSGVERDKGIKDGAKIAAFMAAVREADRGTLEQT